MSKILDVQVTIAKLTLAEKVQLLTGDGWWHTKSLPEHGIPSVRMSDGSLGIRGTKYFGGVSGNCIPGGIGVAASFDLALAEDVGRFIGDEAHAKGVHVFLGPTSNIPRSPLYGRAFENFAEDPVLAGKFTAAMIRGVQSKNVLATLKHLICYEQCSEQAKTSSQVSARALREIYLRPFQIALQESDPKLLMTSYNPTNGIHCSEDATLIQDILRGEWGFEGLVMSDWYGTYSTFEALESGLDLEMPGPSVYRGEPLLRGVMSGKILESTIDRSVVNVLNLVNQAIESGIPFDQEETFIDTPETRAFMRRAAAESVVLLKNENTNLPLQPRRVKKLAVIGPNATVRHSCPGGSATLQTTYSVTALDGITAYAKQRGIAVEYALGASAAKYLPRIDSLVRPQIGSMLRPFRFQIFKEDPQVYPDAKPCHSFTHDASEGLMFDEFSRSTVPRYCYMRTSSLFVPDETGEWEFGLGLIGKGSLYVDGKLVVANFAHQRSGELFFGMGTAEETGKITLVEGQAYELRVDFHNFGVHTPLDIFGAFRIGASTACPPASDTIDEAVRLAAESDAVIIVAGLTSDYAEEGFDRKNMRLPDGVDEMVARVLEANVNSTVVVCSGVQCEMPWFGDATSVVQAFYGGNEAGNGLAAVLFGEHNPSSKLPLTFPIKLEDMPSHPFFPGTNGIALYNEDIMVGYRHFASQNIPVIGSFGFGLSYTTFAITEPSTPQVIVCEKSATISVIIDVSVANTGSKPGAEVVQCYVSHPTGGCNVPAIQLASFQKVFLGPGESKRVTLTLDRDDFGTWKSESLGRMTGKWVAAAGRYTVLVGNSSDNLPIAADVDIPTGLSWVGLQRKTESQ